MITVFDQPGSGMRVATGTSSLLLWVGIAFAASAQGQEVELSEGLVETRVAALRGAGIDEGDPTLGAYEAVRVFLARAASHGREEAGYVADLSGALEREAEIIGRIDAAEADAGLGVESFASLPLEELEAQLGLKRTGLRDAISARQTLERGLAARETNAREMRERLDAIAVRLGELPELGFAVDAAAVPSAEEANLWLAIAEQTALVAERGAAEARLASQPARFRLRRAQRAELTLQIDRLTAQTHALEDLLRVAVERPVEPEELGIAAGDPVYRLAEALVASNTELWEKRLRVAEQLSKVAARNEKVDTRLRALNERFDTARRIVDFATESGVLGTMLMVHWREIDSFRMKDPTDDLSRAIGDTVIRRIEHEEDLGERVSSGTYVSARATDAGIDPTLISLASREALRELVQTSTERLTALIAAESNYIEALSALDAGYRRLSDRTNEFTAFLGSRILWVASHPPLYQVDPKSLPSEFNQLGLSLRALGSERVSLASVIGVALALAMALLRRRMRAAQTWLNARVRRPRDDLIRYTLAGLALAVLSALPVPLLLLAAAVQLDASGAVENPAETFSGIALVVLALLVLRASCKPNGLARVHFRWHVPTCERVSTEVNWFVRWWLPVAVVTVLVLASEIDSTSGGLSRVLMLVALVMLAKRFAGYRRWGGSGEERLQRLGRWLAGIGLLVTLGLLVGVVAGYVYSVRVAVRSAFDTLFVVVTLTLVYAVLLRWLEVARRHIRLAEILAARSDEAEEEPEEDRVAVGELSEATSQLLKVGVVTTGVLILFFLWAPLLPAFEAFDRVVLWTTTEVIEGESVLASVTLRSLGLALFVVAAAFYAARQLPALVELVLRSWPAVTASGRYTASTLLNYVIVGAGIIAVLSILGVQWSQLQWLVAALGVGIGFGLQEIVANFISGLIILFERPIRVGDVVTVGGNDGVVTRIRIRATSIRDWDGRDLLVPNKEFITGRLLNWSLSDEMIRLVINVGVAYGSDVERAMEILSDVAAEHPKVLEEPDPSVVFTLFGDNSLNLALRCHIGSLDDRMRVTTDLHRAINARFDQAGVVISFPQRDVHFDTAQPIRVSLEGPQGGGEPEGS